VDIADYPEMTAPPAELEAFVANAIGSSITPQS